MFMLEVCCAVLSITDLAIHDNHFELFIVRKKRGTLNTTVLTVHEQKNNLIITTS